MDFTRVKNDLLLLGQSLEKLLDSDGNDEVVNILQELSKFELNFDLLKETRIGIIVNKCKKKFQDVNTISPLCSELIDTWKKVAEASKKPTPAVTSTPTSTAPPVAQAAAVATQESVPASTPQAESTTDHPVAKESSEETAHANEKEISSSPRENGFNDDEFNELYESLPQNRKQVVKIFSDILAGSSSQSSIAKVLAFNIESSLNNTFKDNASYMAKFRSLSSNLKKNDRLRQEIVAGVCPTEVLVHLSPAELATDELKQEREAALQDSTMARRTDFYQVKRAEIQRSVGIDPNAGGAFVCKKCKGDKTSYYQMQTRSSDEPMTVFVTCLTCGTKWRC